MRQVTYRASNKMRQSFVGRASPTATHWRARYYIPLEDVATEYLLASPRQSVCTYKGEAHYYHVKVGERLAENAVWIYPTPWLDFSTDVGNISGLLAFYTTAFNRVLLNGQPIISSNQTRETDAHMLASPTIDQTLNAKMNSNSPPK